jgi:hypothetical protein
MKLKLAAFAALLCCALGCDQRSSKDSKNIGSPLYREQGRTVIPEHMLEPVLEKVVPPKKGLSDTTATFNTEDYDHIVENSFLNATQQPLSTFSIDVDEAAYSNIRRYLQNGSLPPAGAVRIEEMINYFDYNYPAPVNDDPFSVITEMSDCPWSPQHKLVHIGLQGKKIPIENLPASNLVLLIDVSGSMD